MDYVSIGTMIGAALGVVSFIMYFPLKRKEIKAKTDNENIEALSNVVHGLQDELARKNEQIDILDKRGYRDWETNRKSTRLNSSHSGESRMPSSA